MLHILIADHDEHIRIELGQALEELGHEVTYAPNGEMAVQIFKARAFDLVYMDLEMPVKNGLVAIQEIRKDFPHALIIAHTEKDPENIDVALEYGAAKAVQCPCEPQSLVDMIDEVMAMERKSGWGDAPLPD